MAEACRTYNAAPVFNVLAFIPSHEVRMRKIENTNLLPVAAHELQHALIGYHFGYLGDISLEPDGNSLARTVFSGSIPSDKIQIIALGGAIDTPHGQAQGYGMDMYMAKMIEAEHGGDTVESAHSMATGILNSYPKEILKIAAEIIAFQGETSSWMLPYILERAKQEALMQKDDPEIQQYKVPAKESFAASTNTSEMTIIGTQDTYYKITRIKDDQVTDEMIICKVCGGINAHYPSCN